MTATVPTPAIGELFSGYLLTNRVSEGNFCSVWEAESADDGSIVAIKVATNEVGRRMLEAEAEIASELGWQMRGVVAVSGLNTEPRPHIVMPWVGSRTFRDVLDEIRGGSDRARAMHRFTEIVDIARRVHVRGLVHGDLKPENILIDDHGQPFLTDFGLARQVREYRLEQSLSHSLQSADKLAGGTLAYLPPECVKGAEPSMAGDVYALGVMLHEVLLGRRPDKAIGPERLQALLPSGAVALLMRALAFDPRDRYTTAAALYHGLVLLKPQLTATGPRRVARLAGRYLLAGLAAFFVALRYLSVVALLGVYAGVFVWAFVARSPAPLLVLLPLWMLHATVRWEGPESAEEVKLRRYRR